MQRLGLTLVQLTPAQQTLESSGRKVLTEVRLAREYMSYGFTTLRCLGTAIRNGRPLIFATRSSPDWWKGRGSLPRRISSPPVRGHCDLRGFCNARWNFPGSAIADHAGSIKSLVGANTPLAVTGSKPQTLAGIVSAARDGPARVT
jgi:hypothetical protein